MTSPLISVIMTAYNSEKFIRESILSVLNQTYSNLQFIIINDGSTDSTAEIIAEFSDPRIEYYSFPENSHIAYATNFGFSKVQGEYIAIMDSDDIWLPEKLEKQLAFLEHFPQHQGCFTWVTLIDENGNTINNELSDLHKLFSAHTETQEDWLRFFFFYGNRLNNPSSLITYDSFRQIGYHSLFYIQAMDFEWWVRFTKKFSFGILEEPLIKYRRLLNSEINISSYSETHDTRFFNEYMYIRYHFFDDMEDDLFIRTFHEFFHCPDSHTPEELLCEKAFLQCYPIHNSSVPSALGLLKLEELLSAEKTAKLLKNHFHFSTNECGIYTGQHILNDLCLQKHTDKINGLTHWLNLSQQHIQKLESDLKDSAAQCSNKDMEIAQQRMRIEELVSQNESLSHALNEITQSTSWKITAPIRSFKDKFTSSK